MTFLRYLAVSAVCLLFDFGLFMAMVRAGVPTVVAGAAGYLSGAVLHYVLSVKHVFVWADRRFSDSRPAEAMFYVASASIGTGLTTLTIFLLLKAFPETSAAASKAVAMAVSFSVVYLVRSKILMRDTAASRSRNG